ncbi:MAG: CHRD domain-containing protein [Ignavibacteria bacterium]|nr:CHRD domain-containing protein [Ignavibacteria bacterium]
MKLQKTFLLSFILVLSATFMIQQSSYALIFPFNLSYSGLQEVPPNASPATGTIIGTYDNASKVLSFAINFSGMLGNTTAGHFHGPAPIGVNAPVIIGYAGFPTGVQAGVYANAFVLTPVQETHLLAGNVYSNLHTTQFPGGEIRTQMILDAPLPVELSSFTSVINKNNVTLNWTTSSETNNAGFDIERSISKSEWTKVGFVAGRGNSVTATNYSFNENGLSAGNYNYRLKQVDFNGHFEYFNLANEVIVGIPSEYSLSQNYPNPFNPSTKIDFDIPVDGIVRLAVYDLAGKEVATLVNESRTAGYYSVQYNAADLSSGMYFYSLSVNGFSSTKRMMLVK